MRIDEQEDDIGCPICGEDEHMCDCCLECGAGYDCECECDDE